MSPVAPQYDMSIGLLIIGGLAAVGVLIGLFVVGQRLLSSQRTWVASLTFIGLGLFGLFGLWMTGVSRSSIAHPRVEYFETEAPSEKEMVATQSGAIPKAAKSEAVVHSADTPAPSVTALPDWTQQPPTTAGSTTLAVVRSGRFATKDEAELHAFDEATRAAAQHFRSLDPRRVAAVSDSQRELVRQSAIRQRYDEVSRHDFGSMKDHPMHQLWLQIELSPSLGDQFAQPWRHSAVEARLRTLTGWGIWLTAAAAVLTLALRLDSASQGQRRRSICFATVFLIVSSLTFIT